MKLHIYGQESAGDTAELAMDKEAALELIAALAYAVQNGEFIYQFECGGESFDLNITVSDRMSFNLPYTQEAKPLPKEEKTSVTVDSEVDDTPF